MGLLPLRRRQDLSDETRLSTTTRFPKKSKGISVDNEIRPESEEAVVIVLPVL